MNKQELKEQGFKYISTKNCKSGTEVWARFTGWEDTIQYYYYFPNNDITSPIIMTINYTQLQMFEFMNKVMNIYFFNKDIKYNKDNIWFRKEN